MKRITIKFLGGTETVTGSKYLLITPEGQFLIDCGLYQGVSNSRQRNAASFDFDPRIIKGLLLTHAHLDHSGLIPLLIRRGFQRKIYASAPTLDLTKILLMDSAKIQEEQARVANRLRNREDKIVYPLYTEKDVKQSFPYFNVCDENEWVSYSINMKFRFIRNGHILGSCSIEVECYGRTIIFSGDLGRASSLVLDSPPQPSKADYLVMESTYGDKLHDMTSAQVVLSGAINDTIVKKGNLLISSFAVGRIEELLYTIYLLKKSNKIPEVPVYLDTPMGIEVVKIFLQHSAWHKLGMEEVGEMMKGVRMINDHTETEEVIYTPGFKIVISASGMLEGGRIMGYLKQYIADKRNTILLTGYQAEGTRGYELKEGATLMEIDGIDYNVQAEVREILSLSAHADQMELCNWVAGFKHKPKAVFLVHGEPNALHTFKEKLSKSLTLNNIIPSEKQEYLLS